MTNNIFEEPRVTVHVFEDTHGTVHVFVKTLVTVYVFQKTLVTVHVFDQTLVTVHVFEKTVVTVHVFEKTLVTVHVFETLLQSIQSLPKQIVMHVKFFLVIVSNIVWLCFVNICVRSCMYFIKVYFLFGSMLYVHIEHAIFDSMFVHELVYLFLRYLCICLTI